MNISEAVAGHSQGIHRLGPPNVGTLLPLAATALRHRVQRDVQAPPGFLELLGLGRHALRQRLALCHAFLRGKLAHFLRDLHRTELGAAHGAEMRDFGRILGQGLVVVFLRRLRVQAQVELVLPAKVEARLAERIVARAGTGVALGHVGRVRGDAAVFSFHPRKIISTGDGGMITTPHADWAARCRGLRQHGMSVPDTVRHKANTVIFESHPTLGYNYRMTDIQAAVGREQLKRLPEVAARRREIADQYKQKLAEAQWIGLPEEPAWARSNWQSFSVRIPDSCDQRTVMQAMLDKQIATRRGIMCAHREEVYASSPLPAPLPNSEACQDKRIILPLYHQMTDEEVSQVADALIEATR